MIIKTKIKLNMIIMIENFEKITNNFHNNIQK